MNNYTNKYICATNGDIRKVCSDQPSCIHHKEIINNQIFGRQLGHPYYNLIKVSQHNSQSFPPLSRITNIPEPYSSSYTCGSPLN